jgi:hypothetical protein
MMEGLRHIDYRQLRPWLYLFFGLLVLWNVRTLITTVNYFDDAFMFLRYAQMWDEYGSMGWNPGERTYGLTSLPYAWFVNLVYVLVPAGWLSAEKLLSGCSFFWGLVGLGIMYRALFLLTRGSRLAGKNLEIGVLILIISSATFRANWFTGMDTSLSFCANAFLIWAGLNYHHHRRFKNLLLLALAAYLSFAVRPDNGLYAVLFPLISLYLIPKTPNTPKPYTLYLSFLIPLILLIALDSLARYLYFGHILPLSFYAKSLGFYEGYVGIWIWDIAEYLRVFLFDALPVVILFLLFFEPKKWRLTLPFFVPLALTLGYFFTVIQIMGFDARYYVPSSPFLLLGCLVGIREVWQGTERPPWNLIPALLFVPAFMFLSIGTARYQGQLQQEAEQVAAEKYPFPQAYTQTPYASLSWMEALVGVDSLLYQLPPGVKMGATEHGMLGNDHPEVNIVCLVGLHNADLAFGGCGTENMNRVLTKEQADFIWMPPLDYSQLHHSILQSAYFQQAYDFFPGAYEYGLAVRKESPFYEGIMGALEKQYGKPQNVKVGAECCGYKVLPVFFNPPFRLPSPLAMGD